MERGDARASDSALSQTGFGMHTEFRILLEKEAQSMGYRMVRIDPFLLEVCWCSLTDK